MKTHTVDPYTKHPPLTSFKISHAQYPVNVGTTPHEINWFAY